MTTKLLLAELNRLSYAPQAIPKFRDFVRRLAVSGRILETDPRDWTDQSLGEVGSWGSGGTPNKAHPNYYGGDIPWLVIGDLNDGLVTTAASTITEKGLANSSAKIVEPGTVLVAMYGSIGKLGLAGIRCATNQAIAHCVADSALVTPDYLMLALRSMRSELLARGQGGTQANISQTILKAWPVSLPPDDEQPLIVERVDELMALCDQLERRQKERELLRDALRGVSLYRLTARDKRAGTNADVQFFLNTSPRLITKPEHVAGIRSTILSLAVTGRLMNSDANTGYERHPIRSVASLQNGYAFKSEWFQSSGIRLLRNVNVGHGAIEWAARVCLPEAMAEEFKRFSLAEGDIVVSLDRPFITTGTKVAIVQKHDLPCLLLQRVGRFQLDEERIDAGFLFLWVQSPSFTSQIDPGRSNGVPHISSKQIESAELILPPVKEQRRIVAEVNKLIELCDELETALLSTQVGQVRLLESLLHEALNAKHPPSLVEAEVSQQ